MPIHNNTSALLILQVSRCAVQWNSLTLSGLTTLSLCHIPFPLQENTIKFLDSLRRMQDLKHLYLDRALASASSFLSSAAFHTFRKIDLPHLSHLLIAARPSAIIASLSCVNVPLSTEIRLEGTLKPRRLSSQPHKFRAQVHAQLAQRLDVLEDDDQQHYDYLLSSLLAQRLGVLEDDGQAPSTPTISSLGIATWNRDKVTLTFSGAKRDCSTFTSGAPAEWGRDVPLQISIRLARDCDPSQHERLASDICGSLPLTNVETVHVVHPPSSLDF